MYFYMLSFPISCMGSELLDLKLIKCEQNNKSIGHQFLNDHLGT